MKEESKRGIKQKTNNEIVDLNLNISLIALNCLNIPIKRQNLSEKVDSMSLPIKSNIYYHHPFRLKVMESRK